MATKEMVKHQPKTEKAVEDAEEVEAVGKTDGTKALLAQTDSLLETIDKILDVKLADFQSKTDDIPEEKPYTFADAMREGSMVTDQAIGAWANAEEGTTCALSAAYFAVKARGLL